MKSIEEKVESLMASCGQGQHGVYSKIENAWRQKLKSKIIAALHDQHRSTRTACIKTIINTVPIVNGHSGMFYEEEVLRAVKEITPNDGTSW